MKPTLPLGESATEPPSIEHAPLDAARLIRRLSDRLIEAQRPLRLLDSIAWDGRAEEAFFASGCRELPPIDRTSYSSRPLCFDPDQKRGELAALELAVSRCLGEGHAAGRLLLRRCRQYQGVVDLLEARGTREFAAISARLFGDSGSAAAGGLRELAANLAAMVGDLGDPLLGAEERTLNADEAAVLLSMRLGEHFGEPAGVPVRVDARLASEASAGPGYLKLRAGARYSPRDLRLLEVHEGWVHLGTTLEALAQPVLGFLSRPTPATTATQEGLAVLVEVLAFASHPARLRRLAQRVEAVAMAEAGADFLQVYRHFVEQGCEPRDGYRLAARTFRGSLPDAGPFTKDLAYGRGLVELCGYLRRAIRQGRVKDVPLLFVGKVSIDDVADLAELAGEGLLTAPRRLPPPFADLRALCAWLCCSGWLATAG